MFGSLGALLGLAISTASSWSDLFTGVVDARMVGVSLTSEPLGIETDSLMEIYVSGDRLYFTWWDGGQTVISAYDRTSLKPIREYRTIEHPDGEQQDEIRFLTFQNAKIYAWTMFRFADPNRPNLSIIDPESGHVEHRRLKSGFNSVVATTNGLVACGWTEDCLTLDPATLEPKDNEWRTMPLMALAGAPEADQAVLADLMGSRLGVVEDGLIRRPVALNAHWQCEIVAEYKKDKTLRCRQVGQTGAWTKFTSLAWPEPGLGRRVRAHLEPESDTGYIANFGDKNWKVYRLDLRTGEADRLFGQPGDGERPMRLAGGLLIAGQGRDLIVYDTRSKGPAVIFRAVIEAPPPSDPRNDFDRIGRLLEDRGRLLVLTQNSPNSRLIEMDDLHAAMPFK